MAWIFAFFDIGIEITCFNYFAEFNSNMQGIVRRIVLFSIATLVLFYLFIYLFMCLAKKRPSIRFCSAL